MRRNSSIVVWLPDHEAHLVIDESILEENSRYSLRTVAIWRGAEDFRAHESQPEKQHYKVIRAMAYRISKS